MIDGRGKTDHNDVCVIYPANVLQFFAKFSAPRSDNAKMV
jgi:hypothetical protein